MNDTRHQIRLSINRVRRLQVARAQAQRELERAERRLRELMRARHGGTHQPVS